MPNPVVVIVANLDVDKPRVRGLVEAIQKNETEFYF